MRDYYYILGVDENASPDQIKSAFRKLSMKFHPDKNNGEKFYENRFKAILEAWDVLSDPARKAGYDRQLKRFRAAAESIAYKDALIRRYEAELRQRSPSVRQAEQRIYLASSRMPTRVIVITAGIMILFFVSLYLFAPREPELRSGERHAPVPDTEDALPAAAVKTGMPVPLQDMQLLWDGKPVSLREILESPRHYRSNYSTTDINGDDIPELLVTYHTGGAHCCNVDHLFVLNEADRFELAFSYTGGLYVSGNKLTLYFYQDIGEYHSCYSCTVSGKLPRQDVNAEINTFFGDGKPALAATDAQLNASIVINLAYLSGRGIPPLDGRGRDDGSRKEIMLHMIAYHFNNHDAVKTKALFDQYYRWNDHAARWKDLQTMISRYEEIIFSNAAYRKKEIF